MFTETITMAYLQKEEIETLERAKKILAEIVEKTENVDGELQLERYDLIDDIKYLSDICSRCDPMN